MSNETNPNLGIPRLPPNTLQDILNRMKPSTDNLGFSGPKLDKANEAITNQATVVKEAEVLDRFEHRATQEKLVEIIKLLKDIRVDTKARATSSGSSSGIGGLIGALGGLLASIGAIAGLLKGLPKILSAVKGIGLAAAAAGAARALITRRSANNTAKPTQAPKPTTPQTPSLPDPNKGAATQTKPVAPAANAPAANAAKPSLLNRVGRGAGRLVSRIPIIGGAIGAVDAVANAERVGLNSANMSTKDSIALGAAGALDGIDPTNLLNLGASASNALFGTQFRDDRSLANLIGYKSAADIAARNVVSDKAQANATPSTDMPNAGSSAVDKLNEASNNAALIETINDLIKALGENAAKRSYEIINAPNYAPPQQMQVQQTQALTTTNVMQVNATMPRAQQFGPRPPPAPLTPYLARPVSDREEAMSEPSLTMANTNNTNNTQNALNITLPTLVPRSDEPSLQISQAVNPFVEQVIQTGNIVLGDITKTNINELVGAAETAMPKVAELIPPNVGKSLEQASNEITSRMQEVMPELKSVITGTGSITGMTEAKPIASTNTPPGGASGDASFFNQVEDASTQTSLGMAAPSGSGEALSLSGLATELSAAPTMLRQTLEDIGGNVASAIAPTPSETMNPIVNSRNTSVPGLLGIDDIPYVNDDQLLFQINSNRI